jgi:HlyD family secretion protein
MMKKNIRLILIAVVVVTAYYFYKKANPDFTYAGTVEADLVDVQPGVASPIDSVMVQEGDAVSAGQRLVLLSCPDIRVAAGQALSDLNRNQSLYNAGSLAAAGFDRSRYASRDAQVKLAWCDVAAPISGTVLSIYRRPGEWARPGQAILTMANLRELHAVVYVPEGLLAQVKVGQSVDCKLPELHQTWYERLVAKLLRKPAPAVADKTFKGTIAYIRPQAEFTPKNVQTREERDRLVYGIKLRFDGSDGILKPGMSIEAELPR